jgi:hypothetical protein
MVHRVRIFLVQKQVPKVQTFQHVWLFKGSAVNATALRNHDRTITTESTAG